MKWSWRIGAFRGIGVYVHATFLILIGFVMRREFETVDAAEMLETAFRLFQTCQCETLSILRGGALVGLVSLNNVGELGAIQAALESAKASRG